MKLFIKELGTCEDHGFYILYGENVKMCRIVARCPTKQLAELVLAGLCLGHPAKIEQAAKGSHLGDKTNL
jgi:hypothetical protein